MKQIFLFLAFITISTLSYAQVQYQKGYFIDTANVRTECYIKNEDWRSNPKSFDCKNTLDTKSQTISIESCKEFSIYNECKYIKTLAKIDISGDVIGQLTFDPNPIWEHHMVFLKVLVQGSATLYVYEKQTLQRFYYSITPDSIIPLICKQYKMNQKTRVGNMNNYVIEYVATNNLFRQQLQKSLYCTNVSPQIFQTINYNTFELVNYFKKYNASYPETVVYNKKKTSINFKVLYGIHSVQYFMPNMGMGTTTIEMEHKYSLLFGFETESTMPYHHGMVSLIFQPNFLYYQSVKRKNNNVNYYTINKNIINLPVGMKIKLYSFKNGSIYSSILFKTSFDFINSFDMNALSLGFNAGLQYKKYSANVTIYNRTGLLDYNSFSIGYKFLEK